MAEFVTARWPEGEMPRTQDLPEVKDRLHEFIKGRARLREVGAEWGRWRPEQEVVRRVVARVQKMGVGPKILVQREDRDVLSVRELTQLPDLGAAPAVEEIHAAVWRNFDVRSGGLWLCRFIDGTHTVSRHGYQSSGWKGAAEDIFVNGGTMADLVKVANYIVFQTKAKRLNAATVIVDQDIWEPSTGWRVYGGRRHYHVHTDISGGGPCNP